MNINSSVLKEDEKAVFEMRSLYQKYGYIQYKMNKFEEYDLYVRNKDFLVSDNIITFTDTDGKLMALKPDVTLSIIKNSHDDENYVKKVYYNENVYRVLKGSSFKEIMQVGLECIGAVDDYCIYEVLTLAAKSLEKISGNYVLDISHMGIVSSVIDAMNLTDKAKKEVIKCIGEKNIGGISATCKNEGKDASALVSLIANYGSIEKVKPQLLAIRNETNENDIDQLIKISEILDRCGFGDKICIDFSLVNDMNYYNGFVFKGFINGIATSVLSGGQYDKLMKKMGKKSKAIGFAVYLDTLERLGETEKHYDVDALLIYDDDSDLSSLDNAAHLLSGNGKSVMVQRSIPPKVKYRQLLKLNKKGVEIVENNA